MGKPFQFEHRVEFLPQDAAAILLNIPAAPGVFSLRGERSSDEPYIIKGADLRRRLRRLLAPPEEVDELGRPILSRRLNLRERVRWIEWSRTGSEFESALLLYCATREAFGPEQARRRLRLHTPFFLRVTLSNAHPRVYATNRLGKKALAETFGPFPSRAAAERYADAVLDLFQLRRCHEDLQPFPGHPGCVYGDMNKCLQPCKGAAAPDQPNNPQACTPANYTAEAQRLFAFLSTRGESLLAEVASQREAASAALDFEAAASLHKHWEKVRAAALLTDPLVRPVTDLRAVILQPAAPREAHSADHPSQPAHNDPTQAVQQAEPANSAVAEPPSVAVPSSVAGLPSPDAAVFLLEAGRISGPERLSTLGVRAVREQTAVGSSLFAQPLMLAPVPLDQPPAHPHIAPAPDHAAHPATGHASEGLDSRTPASAEASPASLSPEDRARSILDLLHQQATTLPATTIDELCDTISLFRRWYYRPEKQRQGEVFLPATSSNGGDAAWPIRRILNGAARIVLGPPALAPPVDREAAQTLKTKIIHPGREGVERVVPVLPRRKRNLPSPSSTRD